MDLKLENKVVLVSGGSRGIGAEICKGFKEEGSKVYYLYKSNLLHSDDLKDDIQGIQTDIKNYAECEAAVEKILSLEGHIDILVNNAGITKDGLLLTQDKEDWNLVIQTNLIGTYNMSKTALMGMFAQRSGCIINISSTAGIMGVKGQTNYCSAKAGIIGLTKSMAKEYGIKNIRVNAIAPGYIETDMTEKIKRVDEILKQVPLARMGTAKEVADMVLFMASDHAGYMNGEVIVLDGGLTA